MFSVWYYNDERKLSITFIEADNSADARRKAMNLDYIKTIGIIRAVEK